jgi:hypothetical protein
MNHTRNYHQAYHKQKVYGHFGYIAYWHLLCRVILIFIGLSTVIYLVKQIWLEHTNYFNMVDIIALIIIPLIMAELVLKQNKYQDRRWNSMILLASVMIGISSLSVFY